MNHSDFLYNITANLARSKPVVVHVTRGAPIIGWISDTHPADYALWLNRTRHDDDSRVAISPEHIVSIGNLQDV